MGNFIVILVLAVIVFFAARSVIKKHKSGGCGGNCGSCGQCGSSVCNNSDRHTN